MFNYELCLKPSNDVNYVFNNTKNHKPMHYYISVDTRLLFTSHDKVAEQVVTSCSLISCFVDFIVV